MGLSKYKVAAGIVVSDMDRAGEFYEGKLGLSVGTRRSEHRPAMPEGRACGRNADSPRTRTARCGYSTVRPHWRRANQTGENRGDRVPVRHSSEIPRRKGGLT